MISSWPWRDIAKRTSSLLLLRADYVPLQFPGERHRAEHSVVCAVGRGIGVRVIEVASRGRQRLPCLGQ